MTRLPILALAAASFAATAAAQFCSDNTYPVHLVTAAGVELPTFFNPATGQTTFQAPTENVYLAFDPALPSGTYYVHVTDDPIDGFDEVLSQNDPMDRFVSVTNTAGVITLSLPFSQNPNNAVYGLGLGGQGQSIFLGPLGTPTFSQCLFKAWYGDVWDLSNGPLNPYLIAGGINPQTGGCAVRSYMPFRVGDGSGSDVRGLVFQDTNHSGARDPGEPGLGNWTVHLLTDTTDVTTTTAADGTFVFANVAAGPYTVEVSLAAGFIATTGSSQSITVCTCGDVDVSAFGAVAMSLPCNGHTIGYWRNCHGLHLVQQYGILATLPALHIVDRCGHYVAPGSSSAFKCYLQNATAWNMAYMLSAQLVAMHCNVMVGFVSPDCVINDPGVGVMTIGQLMQLSIASLMLHPFTPPGNAFRDGQTLLKNALDRANNNLNWQ